MTDPGGVPAEPAGVDGYERFAVVVPDLAGRLVGKRVDGPFFRRSVLHGSRTCDVVFGWGVGHELLDGFEAVGWDHGYGDFVLAPDLDSLRPLGWWPDTALVIADARHEDGTDLEIAPRTVLARQVAAAGALGLTPILASELEFTVFDETLTTLDQKGYARLEPHGPLLHPELIESTGYDEGLLDDLVRRLRDSDIPVESIKAEYSRGQLELVMSPAPAVRAADNHAVFKLGVREMFRRAGLSASFMAKWDEASGGSSCHLHVSLRDEEGANVLAEGDDGVLRHFIGGLERYARDVFLLWAPYPNSYKRLVPGTFAPAALSWGTDNRTTAFRVTGRDQGRHLENRIPGADVNPYLAYAGLLAAGLAGIEEELEPGDGIGHANAYADQRLGALPQTLDEAVEAFTTSAFVAERFGSAVADHVANFSTQELRASRLAVTDWDRRRLFDI